MRHSFRFSLALAAGIALAAPAMAQTVIKIAVVSTEGSLNYDVLDFMEKDLEARAPDVDLQIFPGAQLGKDVDVLNGLKLGTHEMSLVCSAVLSIEPKLGVFEAPFLIKDRAAAKELINGEVGSSILSSIDEKGLMALSFTELGFRQITNSVRPISTADDLAGLRIRVPNSKLRTSIFEALGANPTPVAFAETYAALRQGVVDGQENPLASINGAKFYEVQKYLTLTNHIFTPCLILASPIHYATWSPDVQEAVKASAQAASAYSFERGAELDEQFLDVFKKSMEVSEVDVDSFRDKIKPIWDEISETVGSDLMDKVIAVASKTD